MAKCMRTPGHTFLWRTGTEFLSVVQYVLLKQKILKRSYYTDGVYYLELTVVILDGEFGAPT
jgi:hypothetical protein